MIGKQKLDKLTARLVVVAYYFSSPVKEKVMIC